VLVLASSFCLAVGSELGWKARAAERKEETVVAVTERAAKVLREVQQESEAEQTLRIVGPQGGYHLTFDQEREGDQVVESEGKAVLRMGSDVAESLTDATVDCEQGPDGVRFFLSR
jgi:Fe-S cluster assembly iron-binding protein IscA